MSPISDRTWQGRQSWNREVIEKMGDDRIRYRIKVDAYDFQSYGIAEVWRNEGWRQVHKIPGQQLKTKVSYVVPNVKPYQFDLDLEELRMVTKGVLG